MSAEDRINILVPKTLGRYVNTRVKVGDYDSKAEYIRDLIRRDMQDAQQIQIDYVHRILKESEESGICDETPAQIRIGLKKVVKLAAANTKPKNPS